METTLNQKETNAHLIDVGCQLEAEKESNRQAFIFYKTEDGREFYKQKNDAAWQELMAAKADPVHVHTLGAIRDYLTENPDRLDLTTVMVCVEAPEEVSIRSNLFGGWKERECYIRANALLPRHMFDNFVDPDEFVPYLQSCFVPNVDLDALIKIAGNIVDTSEVHLLDDGVSQTATVRQGAARKSEIVVPSPALLYPFSTFAEVEQPGRKFVFRLSSSPLQCMIKECDGGAWRITAINSIATWLHDNLPESVKIVA